MPTPWSKLTPEQKQRKQARAKVYRQGKPSRKRPAATVRALNLRKKGWTPASFEAALVDQCGVCDICPRLMGTNICADHSHETGAARGLLCQACNLSLGYYEKWQRPAGLRIEPYDLYLEKFP